MGRIITRLTRRDVPLSTRFHRGVWVGFVIAAVVASLTLMITSNSSTSIASNSRIYSLAQEQRIDLAHVASDLQRLAVTEVPDLESQYRISIGNTLDAVRNRQAMIDIADPGVVDIRVGGGNGTQLDGAVADLIDLVSKTVTVIEANEGGPAAVAWVDLAVGAFQPIDETFASIAADAGSSASGSTDWLRSRGRQLAGLAALAAVIRLLVVGIPLVARLDREQAEVQVHQESRKVEASERELSSRLADGMEAANTEVAALRVLERAMASVIPDRPAEMLLADSSMAHMTTVAKNAGFEPPGCGVKSPWSCPAVRRSETVIYEDSGAVRACPYLVDRRDGDCSAVCVPVSFMGGAMGVLHTTGEVGWRPSREKLGELGVMARQTAMRIGTIRSFARAEIQASTDVLTGLPNRRATDDRLGEFLSSRERGSVAMADLDHFKSLNDNYGHEIGDRALRLFSTTARLALRESDWIGRWGGEEFVIVMPGLSSTEAAKVLERLRSRLAAACAQSDTPSFTVSMGVVDTTSANNAEDLVRMADDCLYAAKEEGRDRVVIGPVATKASDDDDDKPGAGCDDGPRDSNQHEMVDPEVIT